MVVKFVIALAPWETSGTIRLAVYIDNTLIHAHGYVHTISTEWSPPKRNKNECDRVVFKSSLRVMPVC